MRPVAIDRNIPQLEECYQLVKSLRNAKKVTAHFLKDVHPDYAGVLPHPEYQHKLQSDCNILQSGDQSIKDAKAAAANFEALEAHTAADHAQVPLERRPVERSRLPLIF